MLITNIVLREAHLLLLQVSATKRKGKQVELVDAGKGQTWITNLVSRAVTRGVFKAERECVNFVTYYVGVKLCVVGGGNRA